MGSDISEESKDLRIKAIYLVDCGKCGIYCGGATLIRWSYWGAL